MELWGKIGYNSKRGHFYVRGWWQGKRGYYSQIPTQSGSLIACKTEELAQLLQQDISREIQNGTFNPARYKRSTPLHLNTYSQTWLKLKKPEISTATWSDYESSLRLHILPELGNEYIPDINKDKLKSLLNGIKRDPKGKKNVMGCLHALMNDAHDSGHILQMLKFPKFKGKNKVVDPAIEYLESWEQDKVFSYIPIADRYIFQFLRFTGARPSEGRAFQKPNVRTNDILFSHTFGKHGELKRVKGKKALNWPMTKNLKELFANMPGNLTGWVFPNPRTGKPYSKNINRIWNRACEKANIKIALNNGNRHSFAMQLLNADPPVPAGIVSRLLRHSDIRMMKRYGEYTTNSLKVTIDNVQAFGDLKGVVDAIGR